MIAANAAVNTNGCCARRGDLQRQSNPKDTPSQSSFGHSISKLEAASIHRSEHLLRPFVDEGANQIGSFPVKLSNSLRLSIARLFWNGLSFRSDFGEPAGNGVAFFQREDHGRSLRPQSEGRYAPASGAAHDGTLARITFLWRWS